MKYTAHYLHSISAPELFTFNMTYCLSIHCHEGLVLCSDSRTNAGFDNISVYSKMHRFVWPGNRFIAIMSSGNLATTQAVIHQVEYDIAQSAPINLLSAVSVYDIADYIATLSTRIQKQQTERDLHRLNYEANFIVAGQIGTQLTENFLIYPQGNFIRESDLYPFLQIGEIKYGKPILDRVVSRDISPEDAARCAMVSMNSTMRSSLSVGPPVELLIYRKDALLADTYWSLSENDGFAQNIAAAWNSGLAKAIENLPRFPWEKQ
jgi:putative proteasome-type protease